jgi:hypothetical protein
MRISSQQMTAATAAPIVFVGGQPQPTIVMYPNAIAMLVSLVNINNHPDQEWRFALQDSLYGRVLRRALAHDIAH